MSMDVWQVLKRPIITEKGVDQKEIRHTLCFEVHPDATKTDIRQAVQKIFKVKVDAVQTANFTGKERRRGRFTGFRPDWKKAYVRLKEGEKMIDFADFRA
jgi:large subunit ribosomal protein L23